MFFKDILSFLGPFHTTRILLKCQGKYLRGSGIDDALIARSVFGSGVIETVLNGTHYVRSFAGVLIVEDIVMKLLWQEFWKHHNKEDYPALGQVSALQKKLTTNERCPDDFMKIIDQLDSLRKDYNAFKVLRNKEGIKIE